MSTTRMIACTAALSWMRHGDAGQTLALGRRRRRPNAALRRAARERDKCRCRFPGCESRRVDLHHIVHWIHGGRTDLENLISLCPYHHKLIHDRGYLIALRPDGTVTFYRAAGTALPNSPPLPAPDGAIDSTHGADITAETIIPRGTASGWIWTTPSTSAWPTPRTSKTREQRDQAGQPAGRHRVQVYEPEGWADRIRQYYDEHPARPPGPVLVPTQV